MGIAVSQQQKNGVVTTGEQERPETSPHHSRTLAAQLVRHLGIQEARRTCQDHHWDNVLAAVKLYESDSR